MNETFYKITVLAILAVFYGCYLIKMLIQRRKGIRTDQMGVGKSGTALRVEVVMKIATAVVPIAELLSIFLVKQYPAECKATVHELRREVQEFLGDAE